MPDTPTAEDVAATVKRRLRDAGISDAAVAAATGARRQTVNRKLNGRSLLTSADLVVIAGMLGITVQTLVTAPAEDAA